MYEVDDRDVVVELNDVPQSSVGAPIPLVLADEHTVMLAYYMQCTPPAWDGTWVRIVDRAAADEPIALIRFKMCMSHMFGPPNDEAFAGHPLATRGLHPYGAFRIDNSSWTRKLERRNSVHPCHRPDHFFRYKHYIFAFHDSPFECVCDSFDVSKAEGSINSVVPQMLKMLTVNYDEM